jgi:hypothetical protein
MILIGCTLLSATFGAGIMALIQANNQGRAIENFIEGFDAGTAMIKRRVEPQDLEFPSKSEEYEFGIGFAFRAYVQWKLWQHESAETGDEYQNNEE